MSEFKREDRYVVIKLRQLTFAQKEWLEKGMYRTGIKPVQAVVVEKDWPEYDSTWAAIEARMTEEPPKGSGQ